MLHDAVLDDDEDVDKYELELVEREVDEVELIVLEWRALAVRGRSSVGGSGGGGGFS